MYLKTRRLFYWIFSNINTSIPFFFYLIALIRCNILRICHFKLYVWKSLFKQAVDDYGYQVALKGKLEDKVILKFAVSPKAFLFEIYGTKLNTTLSQLKAWFWAILFPKMPNKLIK